MPPVTKQPTRGFAGSCEILALDGRPTESQDRSGARSLPWAKTGVAQAGRLCALWPPSLESGVL